MVKPTRATRGNLHISAIPLLLCWPLLIIDAALAGPPPLITMQPTSQTVAVGGDATFVVQATSGTTLSYQWYFQSDAIPGATSGSYTQTDAQPSDAGAYYVAVSNADGTVNSANAIMTLVTLIVTNTKDSGAGSLRQVILDANAATGTNTITFEIPGGGVHTIAPITALPMITGPVILDGWSQPGYAGTPLIELNGGSAGVASGLVLSASNCTIRGLIVNRFGSRGMEIRGRSNTIVGNFIGTDATGVVDFGNTNTGVSLSSTASGNQIGGTNVADRNVISGNNSYGLLISGGNNVVLGNYIGTDVTGTLDLGNSQSGIVIDGTPNNTIGGSVAGAGNVISGNDKFGIQVNGAETTIQGNIIGLNATGNTILGNANDGIYLSGGAANTVIGGNVAGARNVISGNNSAGITALPGNSGAVIQGNYIGLDRTGTTAIRNNVHGVRMFGDNSTIGGTNVGDGNVISGNRFSAIYLQTGSNNVVQGNRIGTDATGTLARSNSYRAIWVQNSTHDNLIGGVATGAANVIANSPVGIEVDGAAGSGNAFLGNSIYSNTGLGIDLGANGVTTNDVGDVDTGPNNLQNFPVLTSAVSSYGNTTILGSLNSTANTPFRIEFFSSPTGDKTGYGEGQRYLGFTNVTTDGSGNTSIDTTLTAVVNAGEFISATATKCDSTFTTFTDTSEFARSVTAVVQHDVATTVSGPTSVLATTNFTYTITLANLGNSTATNVVVSDTLPVGINVVDISGGGTLVGGGPGQVVFDSASSNHISGDLAWTHVTTTAENRLMLVGVSTGGGGSVSAVTYGGSNLTRATSLTNSFLISELWQLVNPPGGTHTVSMTLEGNPPMLVAGAATFSGVDQATPLSAVNSALTAGKTASVTISSASNEIVFDNVACDNTAPEGADVGQTQLWSLGEFRGGGGSIKPGEGSVTMSWTTPNGPWAHVAASVKPVGLVGVVSWTIPRLASGATTNFTITVTAPLGGTLTNSVSSTAETPDSNVANNDGSLTNAWVVSTVQPVADLVTTQTGLTSVPPLTNYTYSVTVSNQGPSTASHVVVIDQLSPMLTFVEASGGGTYVGGVVTWPAVTSLAKGASANFTVTVRAPLSGSVTNTAAAKSASTDLNPANNDGSDPAAQVVTVVSPLEVANTSKGASVKTLNWSHEVAPGSSRILVVGISVDDPDTTIVAADFAGFLPLTLIGQTNGAQTKVALYYLLNPPVGKYPVSINLNTASGIVGGAVSFNGVNQTTPIAAFVGNSGAGTNADLTLASTLGGVVVDTVAPQSPQSVTSASAAQTIEWNLSDADYSGAGSTMPGAPVASPSYTLDSAADWAMGAVALNPATVLGDITLTATGPADVIATSNFTYSISVTNLGSSPASNVVVSDVLPPEAVFVSASDGATNNAGVVTWPTLPNLGIGATTRYMLTVRAPAVGTLTNIVYSTAFTADPDPSNNNGTWTNNQVVTSVAALAEVAATVSGPASVFATADFSYTITLTNAGPSSAIDLVVIDPLPAGVTFVSASDGGTHDAGVVTWSLASLASGEVTNLTVTVIAPASGSLLNTVASSAVTADPELSNNDGSAPAAQVLTTVIQVADIATTVTGPTSVVTNAAFSYVVTVANLGPSEASSVMVSDTLPAGATFVSASDAATHAAGVVTWSLASLPSGEVTNLTVTVIAPVLGSLTNTVASSAVTADPELSNNDGSALTARVVTGVYPFLFLTGRQFPSAGFQVEFHTYPDTMVSVLASTNLVDWVELITTNSGDGHVIFLDEDVATYPRRFYRIEQ